MKVVGIYVLYNPNIAYLQKSLNQTLKMLDRVILIDNSEKENDDLKSLGVCGKVDILSMEENVGIARALNVACRTAISLDYDWAITFDQDSIPDDTFIDEYECFLSSTDNGSIGLLCPLYKLDDEDDIKELNRVVEVNSAITSGALMNLKAYATIGGFKEELFIDSVDTEYSWNLRVHGYKIYQLCNLVLKHHLGNHPFSIVLFGKKILTVTNHNYLRCYYITRNSLKISHDYWDVLPSDAHKYRKWLNLLIKVILFEKDKCRKVQSIYYGILDYKKGIFGKYNH